VGSNLYNLLGILGLTAVVKPITVPPELLQVDVWVLAGATLILVLLGLKGPKLTRTHGLMLLVSYVAYVAWLLWNAGALTMTV